MVTVCKSGTLVITRTAVTQLQLVFDSVGINLGIPFTPALIIFIRLFISSKEHAAHRTPLLTYKNRYKNMAAPK